MIAYKFLAEGTIGPFTGFAWRAGETVTAQGSLDEGIYACKKADLSYWTLGELWTVELSGEIREEKTYVVARSGRLVERVAAWTPATAREYRLAMTLRLRDLAVAWLRRDGRAELAAKLAGTGDPATLSAIAEAAGEPASVLGYIPDAAMRVDTSATGELSNVESHGAVACDGPEAYERERAWQSDWLVRRLGL